MLKDFFDMLNPRNNKRVKGAITIFLLLLFTPFVTIAFVLLEVGRYENTIVELDQAMGLSVTSVLANYDSYLHERFGFLAVNQFDDMNSLYQMYMVENAETMRTSISKINSYSVTGVYPLVEEDVLKKQIEEYMLMQGPTTFMDEVLNAETFVEVLNNLSISSLFDRITLGLNTSSSKLEGIQHITESINELVDSVAEFEELRKDYYSKYTAFSDSVDKLVDAKKGTPTPTPSTSATPSTTTTSTPTPDANAIATLEAQCTQKKQDYYDSIQAILDLLDDTLAIFDATTESLRAESGSTSGDSSAVSSSSGDTIESILEQLKDVEIGSPEYEDLMNRLHQLTLDETSPNQSSGTYCPVEDVNDFFSGFSMTDGEEVNITDIADQLAEFQDNLNKLKISEIEEKLNSDDYHMNPLIINIDTDAIEAFFQDKLDSLDDVGFEDFIDGMLDVIQLVLGPETTTFDPAKAAKIDTDYYEDKFVHYSRFGTNLDDIVEDFTNIFDDLSDISGEFSEHWFPPVLIIALLKDIVVLIIDVVDFLKDLLVLLLEIVPAMFSAIMHPLKTLDLATYCAYNMRARVDDDLIGKWDSKAFATPVPTAALSIPGLSDLFASSALATDLVFNTDLFDSAYGNGNLNFVSCELEYLLCGTDYEVINQIMAFIMLYVARFPLDALMTNSSASVKETAACFGIGAPVYMTVVLFVEPALDALFLANGETVPLITPDLYLTFEGLPDLVQNMLKISTSNDTFEHIIDNVCDAFSISSGDNALRVISDIDSMLEVSYRDVLFAWVLGMCNLFPDSMYTRIANIVLMEQNQYYHNTLGSDAEFYLEDAYTMVNAKTKVGINPLLTSMYDDYSLFTVERAICRGY